MTTFDAPDDQQRAAAILRDHAEGLHDGYDHPDGCRFPGCNDAYWAHARAQQDSENPWGIW